MGANATVVQEAYTAFGQGDIPGLLKLLSDDVEWLAPGTLPQGGEYHGKAEVVTFFEAIGGAWDTFTPDLEAFGEISDELVVGVVRNDGILRASGPSGYGAVHVFTVRDGRITRFREYTDLGLALV